MHQKKRLLQNECRKVSGEEGASSVLDSGRRLRLRHGAAGVSAFGLQDLLTDLARVAESAASGHVLDVLVPAFQLFALDMAAKMAENEPVSWRAIEQLCSSCHFFTLHLSVIKMAQGARLRQEHWRVKVPPCVHLDTGSG